MKENAIYRVVAIDHDLISFVDVPVGDYPVLLITNPKDARFFAPAHEPLGRMALSSHIRVLAFSKTDIESVVITIDGVQTKARRAQDSENLWVASWSSHDYKSGLHEVCAEALDTASNRKRVCQFFSLDGTEKEFQSAGNTILQTRFGRIVRSMFIWFTQKHVNELFSLKFLFGQCGYSP
jgi:hypothetical protein